MTTIGSASRMGSSIDNVYKSEEYGHWVPLLPRWSAELERIQDMKRIGQILLRDGTEAPPDLNGRVHRRSADGHNRDRRRGLPLITRGIGGASPGSDPVRELVSEKPAGELHL